MNNWLLLILFLSFNLSAATVKVNVFKDRSCRKVERSFEVELDKKHCDRDQMIGKYYMINCLTRGISMVWGQYGDVDCKSEGPNSKGGSEEFEPDKGCQLEKATNTYRSFNFNFNTNGALCQFQKCISECKREEACKKKCKDEFSSKL